MNIFVDATSPLLDVLCTLINRCGHDCVKVSETQENVSCCELIVQSISKDDFQKARKQRYPAGKYVCKYRKAYKESKGENTGSADYCKFCKPILYITDFKIGGEQSPAESNFLDSSIWHRGLSLEDSEAPFFFYNLYQRLADFQRWVKDNVYTTVVALEILDFHLKQIRSLYLAKVEEDKGPDYGHSVVDLTPFQSETVMQRRYNELLAQKEPIPEQNLRCLLLDDFAISPLRLFGGTYDHNNGGDFEGNSEKYLLNDDLNKFPERSNKFPKGSKGYHIGRCVFRQDKSLSPEFGLEMDIATTVKAAIKKLNDKRGMYDLIFLDFLLDFDDEQQRRETGVDFINKLVLRVKKGSKSDNISQNKGPLGKFWIFPVSAFSAAMTSSVAKGDLLNFNSIYNLASGADPICTPGLFRFKLLSFVSAQNAQLTNIIALDKNDQNFFEDLAGISGNDDLAVRCHCLITRNQQEITQLLDAANRGSQLIAERLRDAKMFKGMDGQFFKKIFPYLENFLRMYAYHKNYSVEPMLQDLTVMRIKAQQDNMQGFLDWLDMQKKELLSLLS